MKTNRRNFLNFLIGGGLLGWLASVFYPIISYLVPPKIPEANVNSVNAGPVTEFPTNAGKIIQFGRKPVLLIKDENNEFHAFDGTCTHLDCIVQYRDDKKQIWCACHNGFYDLSGRTVSGPPPRPLEEYQVSIVNDEIVIINPTG